MPPIIILGLTKHMSIKTIFTFILGIIGTIILGAIGSGIWERLLSPSLDWFFRTIVSIISTISLNYKDSIYKGAALGFHEIYSFKAFVMIILLFLLTLIVAVKIYQMQVLQIKPKNEEGYEKRFKPFLLMTIICIALSFTVLFAIKRHEEVNQTVTYVVRSLDILRPHIGEQEYHLKMANFYQVQNAEDFYLLDKNLKSLAAKYSVRLPDYKPL
ncbi:MAG: hypothetical protein ACQESN_11455 [Thermotogota bacterium]